jgi:hypothetical protein
MLNNLPKPHDFYLQSYGQCYLDTLGINLNVKQLLITSPIEIVCALHSSQDHSIYLLSNYSWCSNQLEVLHMVIYTVDILSAMDLHAPNGVCFRVSPRGRMMAKVVQSRIGVKWSFVAMMRSNDKCKLLLQST